MKRKIEINFIKMLGLISLLAILELVIPNFLSQDIKNTYGYSFLAILIAVTCLFIAITYRKNNFHNIDDVVTVTVFVFWIIYKCFFILNYHH